ncbi:Very-long-chain 3-oxoacyl-CoA reductase 1 [Diplonema papillatum]|nr:Very-long-chain 3-oxoacyl-CoA reductase 1 [Diplonema papillatum]
MVCCSGVASLIGWAVMLKITVDVLNGLYSKLLRPGKKLVKYGKWAVVTGATDGIGRAMAFALAKQGMNVMLISRTKSKLEEVQKEIKAKYTSVEVDYFSADLGAITSEVKDKLGKLLSSIEVGVLINNVGISYPYPKYYHEITEENADSLVSLNVVATNVMTRLVLPQMLERKRGAVVNVSSIAGEFTNPLLSGYCGTKSDVSMMTKALAAEYKSSGIDFQAQIPLFVATKLSKVKPSFTQPTPAQYAAAAVKAIGYESLSSPYPVHALITYLWLTFVPEWIYVGQIMSLHMGLRKRGLAKEKRDAEKSQ